MVCTGIMEISELEKHFLLSRAYYEAAPHVTDAYGDDGRAELWNMVLVSLTEGEFEKLTELNETLGSLYRRRLFELWRFMMSEETMRKVYTKEPPVVEIRNIPDSTLQIGLYVCWLNSMPTKGDDEDNEEFERRKDLHDYAFGYVNQEAVINPLFDINNILEEQEKQRQTVKNALGILHRQRNR